MPNNFFYNLPDPTFFVTNYGGADGGVRFTINTFDNPCLIDPLEEILLYKRIFEFAKMVEERRLKRAVDVPRKTVREWAIKEKGKLA